MSPGYGRVLYLGFSCLYIVHRSQPIHIRLVSYPANKTVPLRFRKYWLPRNVRIFHGYEASVLLSTICVPLFVSEYMRGCDSGSSLKVVNDFQILEIAP